MIRDAARLSGVCQVLREMVRLHSCWPDVFSYTVAVEMPLDFPPHVYRPPPSGCCHSVASPSGGWKGLKEAVARAPPGGSVLLKAGQYEYGPKDLVELPFAQIAEGDPVVQRTALVLDRSVHLFGLEKAELVLASGIPFSEWGIKAHTSACVVLASADQSCSLYGIHVRGIAEGVQEADVAHAVVCEGYLGLYKCHLAASASGGGSCLEVACGSKTRFFALDCRLLGGFAGCSFRIDLALKDCKERGRLESCDVRGAKEACLKLRNLSRIRCCDPTVHIITNTFADSKFGVDSGFVTAAAATAFSISVEDEYDVFIDDNVFDEASLSGGKHKIPAAVDEEGAGVGDEQEVWEDWENIVAVAGPGAAAQLQA